MRTGFFIGFQNVFDPDRLVVCERKFIYAAMLIDQVVRILDSCRLQRFFQRISLRDITCLLALCVDISIVLCLQVIQILLELLRVLAVELLYSVLQLYDRLIGFFQL